MSDLLERIQEGGFLPLQFTLEPLQKILIDIMDMIKDHETKIENIQDTKADKSELQDLKNTVESNKSDTDRRIDDLEKLINDKTSELQQSINDLNEKADNVAKTAQEALDKSNEAINSANNALSKAENSADTEDIANKLKEIEDKVANNENNIQDLINRVNELDEKVSNNDNNNASDNNEKLEDIINRLKELEDKVSNNENAADDLAKKLSDLDKRFLSSLASSNNAESSGPADTNENARRINDMDHRLRSLEEQLSNATNADDLERLSKKIEDLAAELNKLAKKTSDNVRLKRFTPVQVKEPTTEGLHPVKEPSAPSASEEELSDLRDLVKRLAERVDALEDKFNTHEIKINNNKESIDEHEKKLNNHDNIINDINNSVGAHKVTLDDHEKRITAIEDNLKNAGLSDIKELLKSLQADLASRPDKDLIERLFEKFKDSLNKVVDMINDKEGTNNNYATKDDLKKIEAMVKSMVVEFDEAAAARKCTKCLCCGSGYRKVSGAIPDAEQAAILGAAPISQVMDGTHKPCFVYGSDHELYYSESPRGESFVVTGRKAPKSAK